MAKERDEVELYCCSTDCILETVSGLGGLVLSTDSDIWTASEYMLPGEFELSRANAKKACGFPLNLCL